jgi:penicillin-binding protein 2
MRLAIVTSSNVYFYSLANEMGVDLIHDQLEPFGFGRKTGIDLEGEVTGVLPSTDWKRNLQAPEQQKWYPGETISLGIGQGYNNFTMLQLATAWPRVRRPALPAAPGARGRGRGLTSSASSPATRCRRCRSSPGRGLVLDAMVGVTQAGTARGLRGRPTSGGKTGTAQAVA